MRPSRPSLWLSAGLMAVVAITGAVSCSDDPGSTPPTAAQSAPAAITNVSPPDGSVGPSPPHISVAFDLLRDGDVDLDSVRLALDGRDVTDGARLAGTDDIPQSRAELIYEIESALPEGSHRVEVEYRAGAQLHRYAWEFTVRV